MTKITIVLCLILVFSLFIFFPSTRASTDEPMVGVFYYPWYNEAENGSGHWSGRPEWTVVDIPCFGWYSTLDNVTIKKQLDVMHNAGIDFIILSWWGPNTPYGEDTSCQYIFAAIQKYYPTTMKAFLMVEEILQNNSALSDYESLCDYVNRTYVVPFGDQYFNLDGRPVLAWWASANMTDYGKDQYVQNASKEYNFTCRIIGYPGSHRYRNWSAWTPSSSTNPDDTTLNCSQQDGFVFIEPRFDNTNKKMWDSNSYGNTTFDQNLTEGGYDDEWNQILNRQESDHDIRIVCIYSWNSYDERSAIEPCINYNIDPEYLYSVPHSDPEYLLNRTRYYIDQLRSILPEFQPFLLIPIGVATTAIAVASVAIYRRKKSHSARATTKKPTKQTKGAREKN